MKKILVFLVAFGLFFSPLGTTAINQVLPTKYEQVSHADAKSYRSPSRSFKSGHNGVNRSNVTPSKKSTSGTTSKSKGMTGGRGLMGGLMLGGLAGLLFGGALSSMGAFGEILGLLINLFAIFVIIRLVMMLFRKRKPQQAAATGGYQQTSANQNQQNSMFQSQAAESTTTADTGTVFDEGNISNAVIAFFTNEKGMSLDDVEVILTYHDEAGFGADVMQNGTLLQSLDHFSLIQAIRYWAEHFAGMDANMGLKLYFSEADGVYAVAT
ncbi:DUF2653 family protein [Listeria costaricensis]|uniref:DUF2653 family protein n=1 Tax=Listeria costaricensis TaxID=2026604 RepID=UPI000C07391E|nr:DUF2653 family protein [Listeria costaricensis]